VREFGKERKRDGNRERWSTGAAAHCVVVCVGENETLVLVFFLFVIVYLGHIKNWA
jgi:hypothetical protein